MDSKNDKKIRRSHKIHNFKRKRVLALSIDKYIYMYSNTQHLGDVHASKWESIALGKGTSLEIQKFTHHVYCDYRRWEHRTLPNLFTILSQNEFKVRKIDIHVWYILNVM